MSGNRGTAARRKGQEFQREVAKMLEADGWHVQNVGSGVAGCDLIATQWRNHRDGDPTRTMYVECKAHERAKYPEWMRQTLAAAPPGAVTYLVHKPSEGPVLWISQEPPR